MSQTSIVAAFPAFRIGCLDTHTARIDGAVGSYPDDAPITDKGKTNKGRDEIRTWLGRSASEHTYTTST